MSKYKDNEFKPEMTHKEIAKELRISRSLVQLIEYRALKKLQAVKLLKVLYK